MPDETAFTIRHCTEWCETVGIDDAYVLEMVQALEDDGPDSSMAWPTVARSIGATFWDGTPYR